VIPLLALPLKKMEISLWTDVPSLVCDRSPLKLQKAWDENRQD
jgi:hypothetical protein